MSERSRIALLSRIFGASPLARRAETGIGDDAAVLAPPAGRRLVVSVDEQVEGTHFRRDFFSLGDVGYRATMAAASDLAAMGAEPYAAVASLVLPDDVDDEALTAIARGQAEAAERVGMPIVGGNLARGPALSLATTVLGLAAAPLLRAGAKPGDAVFVHGALGLAHLGLVATMRGERGESTVAALAAFARPEARIAAGLAARGFAHAAIDVSDGLGKDAGAIADASGVVIVLERTLLLAHAEACGALPAASALGIDVTTAMLDGGEDYALVVTAPGDEPAPEGFVRLGFVRAGAPSGVVLRAPDGTEVPVAASAGFDHFAPHGAAR